LRDEVVEFVAAQVRVKRLIWIAVRLVGGYERADDLGWLLEVLQLRAAATDDDEDDVEPLLRSKGWVSSAMGVGVG
jgi:hypothetical protein